MGPPDSTPATGDGEDAAPTDDLPNSSSGGEGRGGAPVPADLNILNTHASIKASEGAVFDVPPPLHIKFSSPSVVQPKKFQVTAVDEFKNEIQRAMGAN